MPDADKALASLMKEITPTELVEGKKLVDLALSRN